MPTRSINCRQPSPSSPSRSDARHCAVESAHHQITQQRRTCLAREILGPLLREPAFAKTCCLPDFDQISVGIAHVAADLCDTVNRWCQKLGSLRAPLAVTGFDVCNAQVHEG